LFAYSVFRFISTRKSKDVELQGNEVEPGLN
jgi:hypothetical protein